MSTSSIVGRALLVSGLLVSGCSWGTVRAPKHAMTRDSHCSDASTAPVIDTVAAVAFAVVAGYFMYEAIDSGSYGGDGESEKLGALIVTPPALAAAGLFTASAVHGYRARCP